MYIGSTGERGPHHLIWEVVDNLVDEAMAGHATKVAVTLQADGGVRVEGRRPGHPGRDAPGGEEADSWRSSSPACTPAASSTIKSYAVSGGLHGVGVSVRNALSTALDVQVRAWTVRSGSSGTTTPSPVSWSRPVPRRSPTPGPRSPSGPTFRRSSSRPSNTLETIRRRLQEQSFLNKA
ncbi:hypothetical protein HBB16_07820 [Pseudonocardia sp. MCCB 268]|nr:hypothetical protein [Pseudonocardia cytotoxica]